jgi:hypothetical protein
MENAMKVFVDRGVRIRLFFDNCWCAEVNIQNLKDDTSDYHVLYTAALGFGGYPVVIEGPDREAIATADIPFGDPSDLALPRPPGPEFLFLDLDFTRDPPSEEDERIVAHRLAWIREALTQPDQDQMLWALAHPAPTVREYALAHVAEWRKK